MPNPWNEMDLRSFPAGSDELLRLRSLDHLYSEARSGPKGWFP